MNPRWQALAREAGLAAEHIGIGVTALGRANYAQHAYYFQAFFALSLGIERAAKLAFVVDHALDNSGVFPVNKMLRRYHHGLDELLHVLDRIAEKRGLEDSVARTPRSRIHEGIIDTLSEFAKNITRYYNLDLITDSPRSRSLDDPVAAWFKRVTTPVLEEHYKEHQRRKHERDASHVDSLIRSIALVRHYSETGETLDTPYAASLQTAVTEFAKPYERMYVLQIARFMGAVLSELGFQADAERLEDIPHLSEFFAIYSNDDRYFRSRKTWSIYQ